MLSFKSTFSLSYFSSSSLSAIRVVSSAYLKLLIFLPAILIPPCASSSPEFLMMYSARLHISFIGYNRSPRVSCTGLSLIPRPSSGRTTLWNVSPVTQHLGEPWKLLPKCPSSCQGHLRVNTLRREMKEGCFPSS